MTCGLAALGVALGAANSNGLNGSNGLFLVGGAYFVVRGLDNIGKWVKQDGRFVEFWSRLFGKHFTWRSDMNGFPILPPPPTRDEQFLRDLVELGRAIGDAVSTPEKGKPTSFLDHYFNLLIQVYLAGTMGVVLLVLGVLYLIFPTQFASVLNWLLVIPPVLSIPVLIFCGGFLYKVRRNAPLLYGATECSVGIMTIIVTVLDLRSSGIDSVTFLKIVGGLYVIVRGLDNVGKYTKYIGFARDHWNQLFGPEYL